MKKINDDELRSIQLDVLTDIHTYCIKNNLRYYLYAGTLLGAVRHNGYIPWDDDIDIAMPRADYDKFIQNYKNKNTKVISLNNTRSYYLPFAKVIDKNTILKENIDSKLNIGVYVDVFPLDNVPDDEKESKKQLSEIKKWHNILVLKSLKHKKRSLKKNILFIFGKIFTTPIPFSVIVKKIESTSIKYNNHETKKIGQLVSPIYGDKTVWPRSYYKKQTLHQFENDKFYIPSEYDLLLKRTYGDYMKLPPKDKRVPHHDFTAWKIDK